MKKVAAIKQRVAVMQSGAINKVTVPPAFKQVVRPSIGPSRFALHIYRIEKRGAEMVLGELCSHFASDCERMLGNAGMNLSIISYLDLIHGYLDTQQKFSEINRLMVCDVPKCNFGK